MPGPWAYWSPVLNGVPLCPVTHLCPPLATYILSSLPTSDGPMTAAVLPGRTITPSDYQTSCLLVKHCRGQSVSASACSLTSAQLYYPNRSLSDQGMEPTGHSPSFAVAPAIAPFLQTPALSPECFLSQGLPLPAPWVSLI